MTISLGGVEFSVKVRLGRSVNQVNRMTKALTQFKAAAGGTEQIAQVVNKAVSQNAQQTARLSQSTARYSRDADAAAGATGRFQTRTDSLASSVSALVGALAAVGLGRFIRNATLLAGRVENLDTVMRNTANTANFADSELTLVEDRIKGLGITTQVSREIMARFAQNNLDVADAVTVSRIAQDAAVVAGINSSQATERLAIAVQRLDTRMLRNLGILVNLRQEYQAYGLATGRVETSLTASEKQQIVLNAVMRKGSALAGNYEASLQDVFKRFTSLDRKIEEASKTIGQNYLPVFGVLVDTADDFFESLAEADPATQVFIATLLSVAATVVGTSSAIALGRVAYNLYTAAVAGNTVASGANATAQIANAGAAAQAALGMNVAAASTGRFTGALAALRAALLANPITAIAVGAAAVGAGTIAIASSISAQAKRAREERLRSLEASVAQRARLQQLRGEIQALGNVENRTTEQQILLNQAMREAVNILPEQEQGVFSLNMTWQEFLKTLNGINRLNLDQTDEEFIGNLDAEIETLTGRVENLRNTAEKLGQGGAFDFALEAQIQADLAAKSLEELTTQRDAAVELRNEQALRLLDELDRRAETAVSLSQRAANQLNDQLVSAANDSTVRVIDRISTMRKRLADGFESLAQIEERRKQTVEKIEREFQQKRDQAAKNEDEKQRARELARLDFEQQLAELDAKQKKEADIRRREETKKAFDNLTEIARQALGTQSEEVRKLEQELGLLAQGVDSSAIRAFQNLTDVQTQGAKVTNVYRRELAQLREERDKASQSLDAALALEGTSEEADVAVREAQRKYDSISRLIAQAISAEENARRQNVLQEKQARQEIVDINEQAVEKLVDSQRQYADQVRSVQDDIRNAVQETNDFIADKQIELFGERFSGQSELLEQFRSFRSAAGGVGNLGQGRQVIGLFDQFVQRRFGAVTPGTPQGDAIAQMRNAIVEQAQLRLQELARSIADLKIQAAQLNIQAASLRALQDISRKLDGPGAGQQPAPSGQPALPQGFSRGRAGGTIFEPPGLSPSPVLPASGVAFRPQVSAATPFDAGFGIAATSLANTSAQSAQAASAMTDQVMKALSMIETALQSQTESQITLASGAAAIGQRIINRERAAKQALAANGLS